MVSEKSYDLEAESVVHFVSSLQFKSFTREIVKRRAFPKYC